MHNPSPTPPRTRSTNTGDRLARGELCRVFLGQSHSCKLTPAEWQRYNEAKVCGFLTVPGAEAPRRRLRDVWCAFTEEKKWPFVVVRPRRTWASIELDMILIPPQPGDHSPSWQLSELTIARMRALLAEVNKPGVWWVSGPVYQYSPAVPIDVVSHLARRLFELGCADLGVRL